MFNREFCGLILIVMSVTCFSRLIDEQGPNIGPRPIPLEEAEILIYLLPQAQDLRAKEMDVDWEVETTQSLNQADFYLFWVVNCKHPNTRGSVTVGYFGVNKHTAEIWSLDQNDFIETPEIKGVQNILRKTHSISEAIVQKYHDRRPDVRPSRPE